MLNFTMLLLYCDYLEVIAALSISSFQVVSNSGKLLS